MHKLWSKVCRDNKKRYHRHDGPAVEYPDGSKAWYVHGKLHRVHGPAIECAIGTREWWVDGRIHRTDGPAYEGADGSKEWFIHHKFIVELEPKKNK